MNGRVANTRLMALVVASVVLAGCAEPSQTSPRTPEPVPTLGDAVHLEAGRDATFILPAVHLEAGRDASFILPSDRDAAAVRLRIEKSDWEFSQLGSGPAGAWFARAYAEVHPVPAGVPVMLQTFEIKGNHASLETLEYGRNYVRFGSGRLGVSVGEPGCAADVEVLLVLAVGGPHPDLDVRFRVKNEDNGTSTLPVVPFLGGRGAAISHYSDFDSPPEPFGVRIDDARTSVSTPGGPLKSGLVRLSANRSAPSPGYFFGQTTLMGGNVDGSLTYSIDGRDTTLRQKLETKHSWMGYLALGQQSQDEANFDGRVPDNFFLVYNGAFVPLDLTGAGLVWAPATQVMGWYVPINYPVIAEGAGCPP